MSDVIPIDELHLLLRTGSDVLDTATFDVIYPIFHHPTVRRGGLRGINSESLNRHSDQITNACFLTTNGLMIRTLDYFADTQINDRDASDRFILWAAKLEQNGIDFEDGAEFVWT
ncbi:hypothetical protein D9757_010169 [Collybiopsis confluens]|uniref:Uncharacterized protein n=1 Tax=Collybiopsis confluens TaxID=2823264 RepID=A0A8H5H0X5_9AGAR|nr:hypothetical protein D9757_010169 [Collybiopsis confluens]